MTFYPYKILGVKRKATTEQIRAAYIARAKVLHPDAGGGEDQFKELQQAYDVLSNPDARKNYDQTGFYEGDPKAKIREAAHRNICDLFSHLIDQIPENQLTQVNIVQIMRDHTTNALREQQSILNQINSKHNKLKRKLDIVRKRLRRKKRGDNIFVFAMEKNIEAIEAQKFPAEQMVETIENALELLNGYDYEFDGNLPRALSGIMAYKVIVPL